MRTGSDTVAAASFLPVDLSDRRLKQHIHWVLNSPGKILQDPWKHAGTAGLRASGRISYRGAKRGGSLSGRTFEQGRRKAPAGLLQQCRASFCIRYGSNTVSRSPHTYGTLADPYPVRFDHRAHPAQFQFQNYRTSTKE